MLRIDFFKAQCYTRKNKKEREEAVPIKKKKATIVKWLLVLLITGVIIYTFRDSAGPILKQLKTTPFMVIAGICLMSVVYHLLEGMVTAILAKQYEPEFKFCWGIGNAFFCSFYRVATLGSGAGIAAMVYLKEHKIDYSKAFGLYMLQYAFHKISIVIYSAVFFSLSFGYMIKHFGGYTGVLLAAYGVTMCITIGLILFCCSERFHKLIFKLLSCFNRKGKWDVLEVQLKQQCNELEEASRYLLKRKKMVAEVLLLNMVKLCFWYGIPYLIFLGNGNISIVETMAITALSVMIAAVIPAPAGIGSTEIMFTTLFSAIVGTGLAGSASLLYRFATFVFPFAAGAVLVIVRKIRRHRASINL